MAANSAGANGANGSAVSSTDVNVSLGSRVCFLETDQVPGYRFLLHDSPSDKNLSQYMAEWKKYNVDTVVRACDPGYKTDEVVAAGIEVHELPFNDGDPPPAQLIQDWLALVAQKFDKKNASKDKDNTKRTIAVHCVAGLGRAPVLVALAFVESGMEPLDAIEFIRSKRRGAINARQLKFLETYVPQKSTGCCVIL
jgi:protein tyrosine phosphatase type 4A